ncbi:MAG: TerB family tellurite resistance protein [Deltaproteobacteria bacterium]|nr:TerB family tellurite resistance protein [Deltaproteobacteria bacterium]
MNIALDHFTDKQKLWYAYLVASAIKSDKEIDASEIDFMILSLYFLDEENKKKIRAYLNSPGIHPGIKKIPEGLDKKQLAAIYTELILIIVSDGKLTSLEKNFLKAVSDIFQFSPGYYHSLIQWAESMWINERKRRELIEQAC